MFAWLKRLIKGDPNKPWTWAGRYRAFLQGLADTKQPRISGQWSLGYEYEITLNYGDVSVAVSYNTHRDEWNIETWSHEAQEFLFYYDCLDTPPYKAIDYVIQRYKLDEMVNVAVAKKRDADEKSKKLADDVVDKYLRGPNGS